MIINSIDTNENYDMSEAILLKIGHFFQMQDDFLDCFGDPTVTVKVGTDIEQGKCCLPIVTALDLCNGEELKILQNNYGIKCESNVMAVKHLYKDLNLKSILELKLTEFYDNICTDIQSLKVNSNLCSQILKCILAKIVRRNE